ncbi:hypothetical protein C7534_11660 [Pseudomonas sp. OV226]|nr:hypothetical protein C7534_11660 [Pseudomonas sp. OV226]
MPSLGEAPNGGAKPFGSFSAFGKGTRCKSETASSRYRNNGYVHHQKTAPAILSDQHQAQVYVHPSAQRVPVVDRPVLTVDAPGALGQLKDNHVGHR